EGAELPWLYRTSGFVLANHQRKGRPVPVAEVPDEPDDDVDPADLAVADDEVRTVLSALAPRDRRILLLVAWEGLDGDELAAVLRRDLAALRPAATSRETGVYELAARRRRPVCALLVAAAGAGAPALGAGGFVPGGRFAATAVAGGESGDGGAPAMTLDSGRSS